jgi:hypothetical protein
VDAIVSKFDTKDAAPFLVKDGQGQCILQTLLTTMGSRFEMLYTFDRGEKRGPEAAMNVYLHIYIMHAVQFIELSGEGSLRDFSQEGFEGYNHVLIYRMYHATNRGGVNGRKRETQSVCKQLFLLELRLREGESKPLPLATFSRHIDHVLFHPKSAVSCFMVRSPSLRP